MTKSAGRARGREGYTLSVTRLAVMLLFSGALLWAQSADPLPQEPPEEDVVNAPREYVFNPLQAVKEMKVGSFYFKRNSYRAALRRYEEALRWNPQLAEAWLRIGEAHEKMKDPKSARQAYQKFLEVEPDSKEAANVKKRLASLPK